MSFSTANLSIVGYALVKMVVDNLGAVTGCSTPEMNSGLIVSRSSKGVYDILLPGNESNQEPLQQGQGNRATGVDWRRDLIFVCPINGPAMVGTSDQSEFLKTVSLTDSAGLADRDFAIIILRSTIPTPTDNNGNQDGPV